MKLLKDKRGNHNGTYVFKDSTQIFSVYQHAPNLTCIEWCPRHIYENIWIEDCPPITNVIEFWDVIGKLQLTDRFVYTIAEMKYNEGCRRGREGLQAKFKDLLGIPYE